MKLEIGKEFPGYFKPLYPEKFEICSHFEVTAAIPTVLFAVTTWKENGKPNVCFHAWSCFHGDKTAFFAVMGNLFQHTHTYANILREKCFCINFLPIDCYGRLDVYKRQSSTRAWSPARRSSSFSLPGKRARV